MKRDWDLIRALLLEIEERCGPEPVGAEQLQAGSDRPQVAYHVGLPIEAGLVAGEDTTSHAGEDYMVQRLTWRGHEFLEAARDDTRWKRAKTTIVSKGGALMFELVKETLIAGARAAIAAAGGGT